MHLYLHPYDVAHGKQYAFVFGCNPMRNHFDVNKCLARKVRHILTSFSSDRNLDQIPEQRCVEGNREGAMITTPLRMYPNCG
jgi:hypothetical protein